jgi:hypothetical protein
VCTYLHATCAQDACTAASRAHTAPSLHLMLKHNAVLHHGYRPTVLRCGVPLSPQLRYPRVCMCSVAPCNPVTIPLAPSSEQPDGLFRRVSLSCQRVVLSTERIRHRPPPVDKDAETGVRDRPARRRGAQDHGPVFQSPAGTGPALGARCTRLGCYTWPSRSCTSLFVHYLID